MEPENQAEAVARRDNLQSHRRRKRSAAVLPVLIRKRYGRKNDRKKESVTVSPVTTAIIAGLVGLMGTMLGGILNIRVERQKQEGSLILEGIKTGDTKAAARNLLFFSDAGLIHLSKEQVEKLKVEAGASTLPVLPPANAPERIKFMPSAALTEDLKKRLGSVLTSYQGYMQKLGYKPKGDEVKVEVKSTSEMIGAIAYYDPDENTMVIAEPYVNDTDLALREYSHRILYPSWFEQTYAADKLWYVSIEWGLATYFPCSFKNNPTLGSLSATTDKTIKPLNLINDNKFTVMRPNDFRWVNDTQEAWGGAFWDIRQLVGQDMADKLLFSSWNALQQSDIREDDPKVFVNKILEAEQSMEAGKHSSEIKAVFIRRGLSI